MGRPAPVAVSPRASAEPGRYRTDRTPYMREIMDALSPSASGAAHRVHEGRAGRRDRGWQQLDRLRHPPCAGADAGGAADGGTGQALLAPAHRSADRGKPGAARAGQAGALARRRQYDAVEGVPGRHPGHDRREQRRRACARCRRATCSSTRSTPIRRRPTRKAIRSRWPRRAPRTFSRRRKVFLVSTPTIQGLVADRAGIRGQRPAAVLRAVPALRGDAVAEVRAAALGQRASPRRRHYHCEGCERPHRRAPQDGDAGAGRMAGDRRARPIRTHDRLPPLGALFADRLAELGARSRGMWEAAQGSDEAKRSFTQQRARRDLGRDRRSARLAAALRAARALDDPARCRAAGCS